MLPQQDAAIAAIIAYERASTRRGPDGYLLTFDDAELDAVEADA